MVEQKIQNYFKRFTAVAPSAEFASRPLAQITSLPQFPAVSPTWFMRIKETATTGSALALASLLLLIVLGGISYVAKQGGQLAANATPSDASAPSPLSLHRSRRSTECIDRAPS